MSFCCVMGFLEYVELCLGLLKALVCLFYLDQIWMTYILVFKFVIRLVFTSLSLFFSFNTGP